MSGEDLRPDILSVTFAINVRWSRPGARESEVTNLQNAFPIDENIRRFQIKMDETMVMDVLNTLPK